MVKLSYFDDFPALEKEPKARTQVATSPRVYSLPAAPPPYRSVSSVHEDDCSSTTLWSSSDSSFMGVEDSHGGQRPQKKASHFSAGKRRSSWTNLVHADETLTNKYSSSALPNLASSKASSTYSSGGANSPVDQKSLSGSVVYVNNPYPKGASTNYNTHYMQPSGGHPPVSYNEKGDASRQTSLASSGVVSDFFQASKGSSYYKFNESGAAPPLSGSAQPVASTPIAAVRLPASPTRSRSAGTASAAGALPSKAPSTKPKRDRMEELRQYWAKPASRLCCLAVLLLLIATVVVAVVLTQWLTMPMHLKMSWLAPDLVRMNQQAPNMLQMDVAGDQIRFELIGNAPFKNNYISVMDFKTNKVAVVDSSLRSGGRNIICFVMDLDRGVIPNMYALQKAARNAEAKTKQQLGWQEHWNYVPSPLVASSQSLFLPEVQECRGARWIELTHVNSNQKPTRCTECYDFCLPEYGIEKDNIRDESYLNVIRRDCFYLFVPEWRGFAQSLGGQQILPNQQQNQFGGGIGGTLSGVNLGSTANNLLNKVGSTLNQDVNAIPGAVQNVGNQIESKWISLQSVPQQVANLTGEAFQNFRVNVNQLEQQLFQKNQQSQDPNFYSRQQQNNGLVNSLGGFQAQHQQPVMVSSQFSPPQLGGATQPGIQQSNNGVPLQAGPVYTTQGQQPSMMSGSFVTTGNTPQQFPTNQQQSAPSLTQLLGANSDGRERQPQQFGTFPQLPRTSQQFPDIINTDRSPSSQQQYPTNQFGMTQNTAAAQPNPFFGQSSPQLQQQQPVGIDLSQMPRYPQSNINYNQGMLTSQQDLSSQQSLLNQQQQPWANTG